MALKVNVIAREDELSLQVKLDLLHLLNKYNMELATDSPDVVFCIGGDGTFLKAVHLYVKRLAKTRFVGVHTGSLGFFADYSPTELELILDGLKDESLQCKSYRLVEADVEQNNRHKKFYAVNEVRIENVHHTLVLDVALTNQHLEIYRGNGVLICGQLGSSGYNKSIGGALIKRDLELLQYSKIAPISNSVYRPITNPLIIGGTDVLWFKGHNNHTIFGYDHLSSTLKDAPFTINIRLSNKKVRIIHKESRQYTTILKEAFLK